MYQLTKKKKMRTCINDLSLWQKGATVKKVKGYTNIWPVQA